MVKLIYNSYWHLYFFPKVKNFVQSKYFIFYYLFIDLWINHNDRIDIFSFLFLIIFYKSIKHPRRISSHPAQIQHPTRPFSVFLSLLIFFSPFFSSSWSLSILSSATPISFPFSPSSVGVDFFITAGLDLSSPEG